MIRRAMPSKKWRRIRVAVWLVVMGLSVIGTLAPEEACADSLWRKLKGIIRAAGKRSGPGPFFGAGVALPIVSGATDTGRLSRSPLELGLVLSQAVDNELEYAPGISDSVSHKVYSILVCPTLAIPLGGTSDTGFEAHIAIGVDVNVGEAFTPFYSLVIRPGLSYAWGEQVRFGLGAVYYPKGARASDFGALSGLDADQELSWEAFVSF